MTFYDVYAIMLSMSKVVEYLPRGDGPPDVLTSDGDVMPPWYVESGLSCSGDVGDRDDVMSSGGIESDLSARASEIGHSAVTAAESVSGRLSPNDMYLLAKEYQQAANKESGASLRRTKRSEGIREEARAIRTGVDAKIAELLGIRNDTTDPEYVTLIATRRRIRENYEQIIKDYEERHPEPPTSDCKKPWYDSDHAERASGAYL